MNIKTVGAAILAGAMVAGCGDKAAEGEKTGPDAMAVSVNGKTLMKSKIAADVETVLKAQGDKVPEAQRAYFKQMAENQIVQSFIVESVLVEKAKAEGYVVTDADRKAREDEFLKAVSNTPNAPKSIEEYFKKYPLGEERGRQEFENGILIEKMIKAQQAKLPAKDYAAEAKKIIADIVAKNANVAKSEADALAKIKSFKADLDKAKDVSARFAELAKENSACPSSSKGGDLGEFTRGQMVKEFDEAAFTLPVGKVSDPVKTQFGYHLVLVTGKTPAVEAKGDSPAVPEKVRASHILVKAEGSQPVPKVDEVVARLKKQGESKFVREFVMQQISAAKVEASDEYKHFLPPAPAKPVATVKTVAAEKAAAAEKVADAVKKSVPVEKPAAK